MGVPTQVNAPPVTPEEVQTVEQQVVSGVSAIKSGYKTTEFWLTLVTNVLALLAATTPVTSPLGKYIAVIAGALTTVGYTLSRAQVKSYN